MDTIQLIHEDPDLLVIDKPAGILSIADGYKKDLPHLRTLLEPEFGRLWIVHRLDKETSGVMVLARTATVHKFLCEQFTSHSIQKEYIALVFGSTTQNFVDNSPLKVDGDRKHRTVIDNQKGKPAFTDFQTLENYQKGVSLVAAKPKTGFTHQIRCHLLHSGSPILGDRLYSTTESDDLSLSLGIERVALHAREITFYHPNDHQWVTFKAQIPQDFLGAIRLINKLEHQ
jgi:RluA family pseudouridine synthase